MADDAPDNMGKRVRPETTDDAATPAGGRRLRAFATALLFVMAALLFLATWAMHALSPHYVWLKSFAEAALVGGLADWFAVTALFRHPMGLPIPHTAIIPRSKDRIGDTLARFLHENFLTEDVLGRQLARLDTATFLADFLSRPVSGGALQQNALQLVGQLLETEAAAEIGEKLKSGAIGQLSETRISPLAGRMLGAALASERHVPIVNAIIDWASRTLHSQEGLIRAMVTERTAWLLTLVKIDNRIADALINGLDNLLAEMAGNPAHPVRRRAGRALARLAHALQHDPAMQAKAEALKRELVHSPALRDWLDDLWQRGRAGFSTFLSGPDAADISVAVARALREDEALALAVNDIARRTLLNVVGHHGDTIVGLVSETVRGWDSATITEKLESAVLRDLQYIRLNGTLIGGTIGIVLHAILVLSGRA